MAEFTYTAKDVERFWSRVDKRGECWLWDNPYRMGYGQIRVQYRAILVHRFSYLITNGSLPDDMDLDHLCHTNDPTCDPAVKKCPHRRCVNPAHLEAVTRSENALRKNWLTGTAREHAAKTQCIHGHELGPRQPGARRRICRTCTRAAQARYDAKRRGKMVNTCDAGSDDVPAEDACD